MAAQNHPSDLHPDEEGMRLMKLHNPGGGGVAAPFGPRPGLLPQVLFQQASPPGQPGRDQVMVGSSFCCHRHHAAASVCGHSPLDPLHQRWIQVPLPQRHRPCVQGVMQRTTLLFAVLSGGSQAGLQQQQEHEGDPEDFQDMSFPDSQNLTPPQALWVFYLT